MPAVEFANGVFSGDSTDTLTVEDVTSAGSDRHAFVCAWHFQTATPTALTYGGVSILANVIKSAVHDGSDRKVLTVWELPDPPTTASDVVLTLGNASFDFGLAVVTLSDVDGTDPWADLNFTADGAAQTGSAPSLSVAVPEGGLGLDFLYIFSAGDTPAIAPTGTGQVEELSFEAVSANGATLGISTITDAAPSDAAMSWAITATSPSWCHYAFAVNPVAAAGGDMTCAMSFGFTVSGTLRGAGAITGTRAMSLTVAGNLDGRTAVTASIPIAFSFAGPMDGAGRMTGTRPMVFAVVGDLSANGELATTASAAFSVVGNLDGRLPATATLSFAFAVAGVLQGLADGVMTLSTGAVFALAGDLAGNGRVATTSPLAFSVAGNLDGLAPMTAALSFAFAFAGDLEGLAPGDMTITTGAAFSVTGDIGAAGRLGTIAPLAFGWSGALRGAGDMFGATLPASFAVAGDLTDLPDISDMVGDMAAAFGWLADLVNSGQGTPIVVTVEQFRAKVRAVAMERTQYLDRFYNYAKRDADIAWVRVTFEDGTRLDLSRADYARLRTTEKAAVSKAGVSVEIIDRRDGEY